MKDFSKENPQLHFLHVKWAITHLLALDGMVWQLSNFPNLNMLLIAGKLQKEIAKLIETNKAYADAHEILLENKLYK